MLWIQIHWIWIRIQDFCSIWIQVRIQGSTINFERKNSRKKLRKIVFFKTSIFFQNYKNKLSPKEFLISWVSELLITGNILNLTSFASILFLSSICMCESGSVFGIRIRIQKTPEYGSNTDLDPQHWLPSLHVEALWSRRVHLVVGLNYVNLHPHSP